MQQQQQQQQTCNNKVKRLGHKKHTYLPVCLPTCIPTYSHTFRQTDRQTEHTCIHACMHTDDVASEHRWSAVPWRPENRRGLQVRDLGVHVGATSNAISPNPTAFQTRALQILTVGKRHFANPADSLFCHIIKIVFCRAVGSGPGHQLPKNAE